MSRPRPLTRRRAFTLMEITVSLAVMSILITGLGSAMFVALKVVPTADNAALQTLRGADIAQQIATDLRYATVFQAADPNALSVTVPDRTGDGAPDTIAYSWPGAEGDPVTRSINGGAAVTVLNDVRAFRLDYDSKTVDEDQPGGGASGLVTLAHHSSLYGSGMTVSDSTWVGQHVRPSLPANATGWRITSILFWASMAGPADGDMSIQIQRADSGSLPDGQALAEEIVSEGGLDMFIYSSVHVTFSGAPTLAVDEAACLVFAGASGTDVANLWIDYDTYSESGQMKILVSPDAGQTWNQPAMLPVDMIVYGVYTADDIPTTVTRQFVHRATVMVQSGPEEASSIRTSVGLPNGPEVMSE